MKACNRYISRGRRGHVTFPAFRGLHECTAERRRTHVRDTFRRSRVSVRSALRRPGRHSRLGRVADLPRFDSPSVFGRLAWPEAGHRQIGPIGRSESSRRYLDRTLVLETTFTTASGTLVLTDALAMGPTTEVTGTARTSRTSWCAEWPARRVRWRSACLTARGPNTDWSYHC